MAVSAQNGLWPTAFTTEATQEGARGIRISRVIRSLPYRYDPGDCRKLVFPNVGQNLFGGIITFFQPLPVQTGWPF